MRSMLMLMAAAIMSVAGLSVAQAGYKEKEFTKATWEEIRKERARYYVDAPSVYYNGFVFKRLVTQDGKPNACYTGNMLYGGQTKKCMKWVSRGEDRDECVKYSIVDLWAPLSGTRQVCVDNAGRDDSGPCKKWIEVAYKVSTNVKTRIYSEAGMNDRNDNAGFLGVKYLQLPKCK